MGEGELKFFQKFYVQMFYVQMLKRFTSLVQTRENISKVHKGKLAALSDPWPGWRANLSPQPQRMDPRCDVTGVRGWIALSSHRYTPHSIRRAAPGRDFASSCHTQKSVLMNGLIVVGMQGADFQGTYDRFKRTQPPGMLRVINIPTTAPLIVRSPFGAKHHVVVQYMTRWLKYPLSPPP